MAEQADRWKQMASGEDCPLCNLKGEASPFFVVQLSTSALYLNRNQAYRGHCQLVFTKRHAIGIEDLTDDEYADCMGDLHCAMKAITAACQPDHFNYASLGNVVPHLHWHIIPRYNDDGLWGKNIWMSENADMAVVDLGSEEVEELVAGIRDGLAGGNIR